MASILDVGKGIIVATVIALGINMVIAFVAFIIASTNNASWMQAFILIFNGWYIIFFVITILPIGVTVICLAIVFDILVLSGIGDLFLPVINFFFGVLSRIFGLSYTNISTLGSEIIDLDEVVTIIINLFDQIKSWTISGEFYQQLLGG